MCLSGQMFQSAMETEINSLENRHKKTIHTIYSSYNIDLLPPWTKILFLSCEC